MPEPTSGPSRAFAAPRISLALFRPDIPQNFGATLRLAACLGTPVHLIEPAGFPIDDRRIRLAALDYGARAELRRHVDFEAFDRARSAAGRRLVLASARAERTHHRFDWRPGDVVMAGRESAGAPDWLWERVDAAVRAPMRSGARSMNVVTALTLIAGEALRCVGQLPGDPPAREEARS